MSVRTPERPMAFEAGEALFGAVVAWATFMVLMLGSLTLTTILTPVAPGAWAATQQPAYLATMLVVAAFIGGAVSALVALVLCAPVAWLARRLAAERRLRVHLVVFSAVGATIGLIASGLLVVTLAWQPQNGSVLDWAGLMAVTTVICAASTAFGWWCAARRALRSDRKAALAAPADTPVGSAVA